MQRVPGTEIVLENALKSLLYIKTKDYCIYVIEWGSIVHVGHGPMEEK